DRPNLGRKPFMMSKLVQNGIQVGNPAYNRMQDQSGSSAISISGGPVRGNNYLLDGVPITDATNRAIIIPSVEAVMEVKVQANTYDAEMARTGGGMFNTIIRSGGNQIHGSLYGHLRRTSWDANSFFNNAAGIPITEQPNSTWGASLNGAVVIPKIYDGRNKTFFSAAIEQYDDVQSGSSTFYAPTALERAGDFSQTYTKSGALMVISDPFTKAPFPGNKIPASLLNPIGLNIANTFVAPKTTPAYYGDQDLTASAQLKSHAAQKIFKLDENFTTWWRASASYARYYSLEPGNSWFTSISSPDQWRLQRRVDATAINNDFTLSPSTVVSVRYG
ncbi:MAG TPA: TonB-dependent receptor, partial [Solibacterales bacterium]|nr:TonB-dependent receptor [Bryobacterales bacterium]